LLLSLAGGTVVDWLRSIDRHQWWLLVVAAGIVIAAASIAASWRHAVLIGLGLLGIGIGELINHPPRRRAGLRFDSHPRSPKFFGIILDIGGSAVLLAGFYKLLAG